MSYSSKEHEANSSEKLRFSLFSLPQLKEMIENEKSPEEIELDEIEEKLDQLNKILNDKKS